MPRPPLSLVAPVLALALAACGDDPAAHVAQTIDHPHTVIGGAADALATTAPDGDASDTTEAPDSNDAADVPVEDSATAPDVATDTTVASDTSEPDVIEPRPPPPVPPLTADELAAVQADLADALDVPALAGRVFGGLVVDLDTDQTIWNSDADRLLIPASNTKVFTTACALDRLGEEHRMLTRVLSTGTIAADGTLAADLDLHCEHDFTWSRWFYGDERHPLDRIADALWQRGLRHITGDLGIWGAYLYDGYHFGTYDPAAERLQVAGAWRAALTARGIVVDGSNVDHATMEVPPGTELTRWESIPLGVDEWAINRVSHNEMADILVRHLGYVIGGASDYPTGDTVIRDWLSKTGTDVTGFELHDGSGLAVANRVSARQLVGLYRYMTKSPLWPTWRASLSIGGAEGPGAVDDAGEAIVTSNIAPYNGTLAYRVSAPDIAGRVFGKSGTNAGITTSGVLYHRYDGHLYAFAFLMNNLPADTATTARLTQDVLVAAVGKDLRGRGARPAAPTLGCVRGVADGRIEVAWTPVDGLVPAEDEAGYFIETSRDGKAWPDAGRHFSLDTATTLAAPSGDDAGSPLYVRVRAATQVGVSDPSDVYAARAVVAPPSGASVARVLLVDADDRWQRQPVNENPMGAAHAFMVAYAAAMPAGLAFDTCPNEALTDGGVSAAAYDAVVWDGAEESATDESIAASEATLLSDYLGLGGSLFVSGAEIAWDLDPSGNPGATSADRTFYQTWLRASYAGDDAGVFVVEGTPSGLLADRHHALRLGFWTPGAMFVAYPDELLPQGGASACLVYDGPGTVAGLQYQGDYDLVSFGFPFESIDGAPERALVMRRVLAFFGLVAP